MSWDVVIFSSNQKIISLEDLEEEMLLPIDFNSLLEDSFENVIVDGDHREIKDDDYSINYYVSDEPTSNMLFNLYGERALFELIRVSKKYGWQIFDTGNGQMLDLHYPEKNGYQDFQSYLQQILKNTDNRSES